MLQPSAPGQAATLWYNEADAYPPGTRTAAGQPVPGDLAFRTLSLFDPDRPWLTPEEYAKRRAEYVKSGKGTPPPGAEPLPEAKGHDAANPE